MSRTAAALIIGNEILTGKIQEANVAYLGQELFALGVQLRRVVVCPDEIAVIAADLSALREAHDVVFTSGGVGPTHDDVTMKAVARSLGREVVRSADLERLVRGYFGDGTNEGHLRMADVPQGAELIRSGEMPWPTVAVENVYVLPGVPEIFRAKFPVLRDRLRADAPFLSRSVYSHADEFELAPLLEEVAAAHTTVAIGSYVHWSKADYRVKLTFDGTDRGAVDDAVEALLARLPADRLHSVE